MPIIPWKEELPDIKPSVWIAPSAWVTGRVSIDEDSSVFFGAAIRGDIQRIIIGRGTNIQDNAVLHTSIGLHDLVVGSEVTVGHGAILHGCTIKDHVIVGMGATVLDNAVIEENCIIGANSLVTMRTVIPAGHLAVGSPAKPVRKLTEKELNEVKDSARRYQATSRWYREFLAKSS